MFRYLICLVMLLVICSASAPNKKITSKEVISQIPTLYTTAAYKGEGFEHVFDKIDSLPSAHLFSKLTNQNRLYLDYITVNYARLDRAKLDSLNTDLQKRHQEHVRQLQNDPVFTRYFLEMSYYYLQAQGVQIKDYKPAPKLTLTEDELVAIATKFFYATSIKPNNAIGWKICVGFNEHHASPKTTFEPLVEAFCFQAVLNNTQHADYPYFAEFQTHARHIGEQTKEISDKDQKLQQARQQMYSGMQKSEALKKMLLAEYRNKKAMLNFEVKG